MANGPTLQSDQRDVIEDEAASWFLLAAENPDDAALRKQILAWCARSVLHQEIWDRTRITYHAIGHTLPAHEARWRPYAEAAGRTLEPPSENVTGIRGFLKRRGGRRLCAAAAVVALAACLAFAALPAILLQLNADYVTSTAELRTITLEDGSQIHLAPKSAVDLDFSSAERAVRLLSGQAFFEVTENPGRPFVVTSGDIVSTVLGTKFDVRLEEAGASVAVKKGHVRVADRRVVPPISQDLLEGDLLRLSGPGQAALVKVPADEIGSWSDGKLVARYRPVSEIVDQLRGYYSGLIVLSDQGFAQLEVSGVYDMRDPLNTLENLARLHGSTMRRISPWLVVVTPF